LWVEWGVVREFDRCRRNYREQRGRVWAFRWGRVWVRVMIGRYVVRGWSIPPISRNAILEGKVVGVVWSAGAVVIAGVTAVAWVSGFIWTAEGACECGVGAFATGRVQITEMAILAFSFFAGELTTRGWIVESETGYRFGVIVVIESVVGCACCGSESGKDV